MNANLMSKKIEMTKTEAKAAGKPNTAEYNTLLELMNNFPGYQIEIVKTAAKKVDRFKGLDYDYMKDYIESHDESKLEIFYELRGLDKDGKKVYTTDVVADRVEFLDKAEKKEEEPRSNIPLEGFEQISADEIPFD